MKCILMDVEGTTTSISFVHDELFPYAFKRLESYLQQHQNETAVIDLLQETTLTIRDEELKLSPVKALKSWIKTDRKHPALKKTTRAYLARGL